MEVSSCGRAMIWRHVCRITSSCRAPTAIEFCHLPGSMTRRRRPLRRRPRLETGTSALTECACAAAHQCVPPAALKATSCQAVSCTQGSGLICSVKTPAVLPFGMDRLWWQQSCMQAILPAAAVAAAERGCCKGLPALSWQAKTAPATCQLEQVHGSACVPVLAPEIPDRSVKPHA